MVVPHPPRSSSTEYRVKLKALLQSVICFCASGYNAKKSCLLGLSSVTVNGTKAAGWEPT